jgi:hypothetical protein
MIFASVIALSFATYVSADYFSVAAYGTSTICGGTPMVENAMYIDCQVSGSSSYRINCIDDTSAEFITYYTSTACDGPFLSSQFGTTFGCVESGDASSYSTYCRSGAFEVPSPSASVSYYQTATSCPPQGNPTNVVVYDADACIENAGLSYKYGCTETNITAAFYPAPGCTGQPFAVNAVDGLGCEATSQGVTVGDCDVPAVRSAAAAASVSWSEAPVPALASARVLVEMAAERMAAAVAGHQTKAAAAMPSA